MAVTYSDDEIDRLLAERKRLPNGWWDLTRLRSKRGHEERDLDIAGAEGGGFRLILRQSLTNPLDFSVVLAVKKPQSNQVFRLRRHDGKSHEHTNKIEKETFYDFHIHMATQRYQEIDSDEDAYAKVTDMYSDFRGALDCMITDANLETPHNDQLGLL